MFGLCRATPGASPSPVVFGAVCRVGLGVTILLRPPLLAVAISTRGNRHGDEHDGNTPRPGEAGQISTRAASNVVPSSHRKPHRPRALKKEPVRRPRRRRGPIRGGKGVSVRCGSAAPLAAAVVIGSTGGSREVPSAAPTTDICGVVGLSSDGPVVSPVMPILVLFPRRRLDPSVDRPKRACAMSQHCFAPRVEASQALGDRRSQPPDALEALLGCRWTPRWRCMPYVASAHR